MPEGYFGKKFESVFFSEMDLIVALLVACCAAFLRAAEWVI